MRANDAPTSAAPRGRSGAASGTQALNATTPWRRGRLPARPTFEGYFCEGGSIDWAWQTLTSTACGGATLLILIVR